LVGVARKALDAISPGNVLNQRPYIVTRSYTPTQIYTFIHTKTYTHVSARARTHERKPMLVCVHAQVHTKSHTHTHTHPLAHTHTRAPHTDTPKKSRVRARERAYTHTHTRTHPPTNPHAVYAASFWQCRKASVRPPELLASRRSETRSEIRPQGAKYWHCYR
jgi:hypothetical protein